MAHSLLKIVGRTKHGIYLAVLAACIMVKPALAATPGEIRALILQPVRDELSDIDLAGREADRRAAEGITRLEEWLTLTSGAAGYIENVRQRLLERQARERACHDLWLTNFDALVHPDGKAGLPEFGVYTDAVTDRANLLRSIDEDRKRMAAELDRWTKGEAAVALAGFGEYSLRSLERDLDSWRRRIDEAKQAIQHGEARVDGRAWFFNSADRKGLAQLRLEIEKRLQETESRLAAHPESVSLREVGFSAVVDVDRELENTRRTLNELEAAYSRKDYRLGRWGETYYAGDLEKRIAALQGEQDELRRSLNDGTIKLAYPDGGYSRKDLEQRIAEQQQKIAAVNKAVAEETYKVDVYGVGLNDARWMKDVLANPGGFKKAAQAALQTLPTTARVHKGVYESWILLYQQWISAIPKMAQPRFVRRDLEIHQAKQVLAEFEGDFALAKARYERRLAWLDQCRRALTGEALALGPAGRPAAAPPTPLAPPAVGRPDLPAVYQVPSTAEITDQGRLVIEVLVDGDSELHITPDGLYWVSGKWAKPGRHEGRNEATYVNGKAWYPKWGSQSEGGPDQTAVYPMRVALDRLRSLQLLSVGTSRDSTGIEQRERISLARQGNEIVIRIPDSDPGSRWYRFELMP